MASGSGTIATGSAECSTAITMPSARRKRLQAGDRGARRQAGLHQLLAIGGANVALKPHGVGTKAALLHLLRETGEPGQRVFDAWRDEAARTARPPDQTLLDQQLDCLARGDARHADCVRQRALRGSASPADHTPQ